MKKVIIISSLLLAVNAFAEEVKTADSLKEKTLQACKLRASDLPEEEKANALAVCSCVAEKTDYNLVLDAQNGGDKDAAKQHIQEVINSCRQEIDLQE